jgi:glycerol-3-phosphate dehydrogenase
MTRHLARLADDTFDTVVIGGGIYGLSTAHALAERGFSVALIERNDFGGATSFNSLKTVHGGIRSLQHLAFGDTREFLRERRAIATMAPHLVRVLPFVVPTAWHPVRNRPAMHAFLLAYDAVAAGRNAGLDPAVHLPASYTVGRARAIELNPLVERSGLTGAAIWHDYQLHSPERFAIALAAEIMEAGGATANYVEARTLMRRDDRIVGVTAADTVSGQTFDIRGRVVVNAAGPWAWQLLAASRLTPRSDAGFSLALNLVVDHAPLAHAVGGVTGGRFLFLVPWRDRSILGTSHEGFHTDPDPRPGAADIETLLREGQQAFPLASLRPESIRLVHRGLLPARARGQAHGALLKRSVLYDHSADGVSGLLTVVGVRYTTARATGQAAANAAARLLGRTTSGLPPRALASARFEDLAQYRASHPGRERLIGRYGTAHSDLPGDTGKPLAPGTSVTRGEILYAVRNEMAITLADVALRRTDLAAGGHPGDEVLTAAASVMADECGWNRERVQQEVRALEAVIAQIPAPSARRPSG